MFSSRLSSCLPLNQGLVLIIIEKNVTLLHASLVFGPKVTSFPWASLLPQSFKSHKRRKILNFITQSQQQHSIDSVCVCLFNVNHAVSCEQWVDENNIASSGGDGIAWAACVDALVFVDTRKEYWKNRNDATQRHSSQFYCRSQSSQTHLVNASKNIFSWSRSDFFGAKKKKKVWNKRKKYFW